MKTRSVLFILGAIILLNPTAFAQRGGGETRGGSSSGETRGSSDGGSSRGDSGGSRSDWSSSSSSGSSDSGSYGGSTCCDSGGSYYDGGSYGGYSGPRVRELKIRDLHVGQKVELIETGDQGVISYIKNGLFKNYFCIEFDVDHSEECGFKVKQIKLL